MRCSELTGDGALQLGPALLLVIALLAVPVAVSADLPPGHQVDEPEICFSCHDLSQALDARFGHAPARNGDCSACHNPHVSRFSALLRDRPGALCAKCHTKMTEALDRPVVHAPVREQRCADCHTPHGGDHAGLLRQERGELCSSCHGEVAEWMERPVRHAPFALGECSKCHDPHAADEPGLLREPPGKLCTSCHGVDAAFRAKHHGYPVERADCTQCHDPHASSRAGLFRESIHEPFASDECSLCHQQASSGEPFGLVASQGELCGACHPDAVDETLDAPFPHVSAGGGRCTACHNPHTGSGDALLRRAENDLCLTCHDPGGSASGRSGRYATHGDGLACTNCHRPHGGQQPLLFSQSSIDVCGTCHTHEHGVVHPLGEETRDPRNGAPMTCLSCHGVHDAPYEHYLHRSGEGDLCLGCHKEIGGKR